MSYLGKEYKFQSQENFDQFLKFCGVPEERIAQLGSFKVVQKLEKDGDTYTSHTSHPGGAQRTTFKSGVEFDEATAMDKSPSKTTYTVDGNTVLQVIKSERGHVTFKREYNGDDLTETVTANGWDGTAKRYYKA